MDKINEIGMTYSELQDLPKEEQERLFMQWKTDNPTSPRPNPYCVAPKPQYVMEPGAGRGGFEFLIVPAIVFFILIILGAWYG